MKPTTIDQVISKLETIIQWSKEHSSRAGYFASLYLRVTRTIKSKLGKGFFDNDERLERLDVIFANRYFDAYEQYLNKDPALPKSWAVAFDAVDNDELIIVQHLLLGISAHINIDLGVASAQTAPGAEIQELKGDFQKVNDVLAALVPTSLNEVSRLSPLLHLLEDVAVKGEEAIINFSIKVARDFSWMLATQLAPLSANEQGVIIEEKNVIVAKLGERVVHPSYFTESILKNIRAVEVKNVDQIINTLNAGNELMELIEKGEETILSPEELKNAPNYIYYFKYAEGRWKGKLNLKIKSWSQMFGASIGFKNMVLLSKLRIFQVLFGKPTSLSTITIFPNEGKAGIARCDIKIHKGWLTLAVSKEEHILAPDGKRATVDAKVRFGFLPFLFNEQDVYPMTIYDKGTKGIGEIDLLGGKFTGNYSFGMQGKEGNRIIENEWLVAEVVMSKL
jgi:hypothetical protein